MTFSSLPTACQLAALSFLDVQVSPYDVPLLSPPHEDDV